MKSKKSPKTKVKIKKLALHKESIENLSDGEAGQVRGGKEGNSTGNSVSNPISVTCVCTLVSRG